MIFVELASELGSAIASRGTPVFLLVTDPVDSNSLPSSLRDARQVDSDAELLSAIADIN